MHSVIAHHLLVGAQPTFKQQSTAPSQLPPICVLAAMLCGMDYSFDQFRVSALTVLPPSCSCSLAEQRKGSSFRVRPPYQQLKHQYVINIILTQNPNQHLYQILGRK